MVRFAVVTALFGLFRPGEPLHQARKLAIGHRAGLFQTPESPPDDPGVPSDGFVVEEGGEIEVEEGGERQIEEN